MSTLYVDTITEKTSGNGVQIPGHVVQVQQVVTSASQVSSSQTAFVDITGATLTITPKSASSKILVMYDLGAYSDSGSTYPIPWYAIVRGSTVLHEKSGWYTDARSTGTVFGQTLIRIGMHFLDSPSTTSATTYKLQYKSASGGSGHPTLGVEEGCVFTLMEIAQ
jgi:hypothetical protein